MNSDQALELFATLLKAAIFVAGPVLLAALTSFLAIEHVVR